jgi:co-chaperonin GroES (HSP10)
LNTLVEKKQRTKSGISPSGDRVLVQPDEIEEEITQSGIVLPPEAKRRYEAGQASGVLVAVGPDAFRHVTERVYTVHDDKRRELIEERVRGYVEPFAQVGDRVAFAKYSGLRVKGEDGIGYILLNDEDITAKISDNVEFTDLDTRKGLGNG